MNIWEQATEREIRINLMHDVFPLLQLIEEDSPGIENQILNH